MGPFENKWNIVSVLFFVVVVLNIKGIINNTTIGILQMAYSTHIQFHLY